MELEKGKGTLVTGTIGDDIHGLGMRFLEYALKSAGFKVVSLGIQTSQEDFIKAAIETDADAIMVSSLSGHGQILCAGLREKCAEAGLKDILLYAGGYLTTGDITWEATYQMFQNLGYNRVYPSTTLPSQVVADLEKDLA
jgi:methylaspartate mutase sigma subunit